MGKVIVVFILDKFLICCRLCNKHIILDKFLSALLKLESKLIVAACRYAGVIRGIRFELGKFVTNSENSPNHTGIPTCRNN
jgi:hypothetical protein